MSKRQNPRWTQPRMSFLSNFSTRYTCLWENLPLIVIDVTITYKRKQIKSFSIIFPASNLHLLRLSCQLQFLHFLSASSLCCEKFSSLSRCPMSLVSFIHWHSSLLRPTKMFNTSIAASWGIKPLSSLQLQFPYTTLNHITLLPKLIKILCYTKRGTTYYSSQHLRHTSPATVMSSFSYTGSFLTQTSTAIGFRWYYYQFQ